MEKQQLPQAVRDALRKTNLGYLHNETEAIPYALTTDRQATTHGAALKGEFIGCLAGSMDLPAGTEGWLFTSQDLAYSKVYYKDDEWLPMSGADILLKGTYFTWVTLVDICGRLVVAECFKYIPQPTPKVIGKVE